MAGNEVQVADGDLDTTFGTGGIVTTDFSNDFDFGASVVIQPDGKIVVVGWSFHIDNRPNPDFVLARYMPDGSLDPTFDNDGKVITDFASQDDMYAVTLQADGKILLAGTVDMSLFELVRYNSDGSLDTTFDVDGIVTTALGQNVKGSAYAIAVQPDEKIVLAGQMWSSSDSDFALVRYNNDGSLDTGFGGNGIVTTDFGTHATGNAVVIQPTDGKIIVAGESGNTDNKSITLARYNSDGSLDTTFDSDGKVITSLGINDIAEDLTLQPDGKIIAAGSGKNSDGDQDFVLVRYNNDGSLDTTFGLNGRVLTDFGSKEHGRAVAVQPDGRILMTGAGNDRTTLALARYQSNGALDTSFGVNGKVITSVPDTIVGFDLALQPDHNIIVVGGCCNSSNVDFMVARYIYHAAPATTLTVTKTADTNDGICDLDCSLREAIVSSYDGDVIRFDSSLSGKTITLASTLVIDKDLTIDASLLASKIVISGDNSVTVFLIISPATVTLDSLVITKGYSPADAGGIFNDGTLSLLHSDVIGNSGPSGAGIRNGGTVNLVNSNISTNVGNFGGGVDNRGSLNITNSTVSGNIADQGAGIMNSYGSVTIVNSTFSGNHSTVTAGGAIINDAGTLYISGSTFSNNVATTEGGAIYNNVGIAVDVTNSTFSRNSSSFGGGIINVGSTLNITDSSFVENSSGSTLGNGGGGGIYNSAGSTLKVTNTTFSKNTTTGSGGGIVNSTDSNAVLDHTTFLENEADSGGAIYNDGNMIVMSSEFTANVASRIGGGIFLSGFLDMKDSTLSNNSAGTDAGGLFIYSSHPILTSLIFNGNSAKTGAGGGLVNYLNSNPVLDNVIFENNSAVSGGGVANINSSLTLTNGKFINNTSDKGGGMYSLGTGSPKLTGVTFHGNVASADGGGLYNDDNSTPSLTNVTFHNNSAAAKGGGVYNYIGSHPSLINTTLSSNTAGSGGGIYNDLDSNATLMNSIVWGNSGGEIANFMSNPDVRYSIVQGGYAGTGNLDQNPLLGPLQNNGGFTQTMALLPGSPAINAGSDANCPLTDQRGMGRPQGLHCDMGAYEFIPSTPVILTVTKTADTNDGLCNADCSLREALVNSYDGDTIRFGLNGTFLLASDLPVINKTIAVDGSGKTVKLDGGGKYRIFKINETGDLTLKNLALQNGHSGVPCMADIDQTCGGAIYNDGALSAINVTFSSNHADIGGAIFIEFGTTKIESSIFTGNAAVRLGGGILNWIGTLDVVNSTFYGNSAAWDGGAIYNDISDLTLTNNTFSSNSAERGGAVYNSAGNLAFVNNILANSTAGDDCFNESPYAGISLNINNLIETNAAAPNNCGLPFLTADPRLGPLASNGGVTQTLALLKDSPAIDAGNDADCPAADQRDVARPYGTHCDIGAYEQNGSILPVIPTFTDVPMSHPYWQDVETLYAYGLTGGCQMSPFKFCPDQIMNRAQAAAFMLRGNFGPSYVPPTPTHIFKDDWSKGTWAEGWAEGMRNEGFSAGCLTNPLKYCPWDQIPREQTVIFALKLKYGKLYTPPPATGTLFADMTNPSFYATAWAEQAYKEGLITNCGTSGNKPLFCPKKLASRGLAAYMIVRARNLTMP